VNLKTREVYWSSASRFIVLKGGVMEFLNPTNADVGGKHGGFAAPSPHSAPGRVILQRLAKRLNSELNNTARSITLALVKAVEDNPLLESMAQKIRGDREKQSYDLAEVMGLFSWGTPTMR
jgi:hypothetical protein